MKKPCAIDGCERLEASRGWCNIHYQRWYKYGDVTVSQCIHGDDERRFWSKVDKNGPVVSDGLGACWLWTASIGLFGYAQIRMGGRGGQMVLVHRWSYEHTVGPIPAGSQLDHLCRVRHCVRPEHLEPVTAKVNTERGTGPTAANSTKTSCPKGHEYTGENTYLTKRNGRACRACARASTQEWRRRSATAMGTSS
jgi:hypothetical protein